MIPEATTHYVNPELTLLPGGIKEITGHKKGTLK